MIGRALNKNNDLVIEDGEFKLVRDGAEVVQHVRTRLQFYANEWFLDLTAGTPYFEQIFIKPVDLANVESILKTRILQTPGVLRLIDFAMSYIGESQRKLTVTFSAETEYGIIDDEELFINV